MSNTELFTEAIDTAITLGWALLVWVVVFAAVSTLAILGATAGVAYAVRALWRAHSRPSWAHGRLQARTFARTRTRRSQERVETPEFRKAA